MIVEHVAEAAIMELKWETLPLRVVSWRVETGFDTIDDPAIWVWATLEPGAACARDVQDERDALKNKIVKKIWERVRRYDDKIWVYVNFTESESDATQ